MNKFIERLSEVPSIIEEVKKSSDEFAYKIWDKPRLDMPKEMESYIEEMVAFGEKFKE
jgi:hypothetical protein